MALVDNLPKFIANEKFTNEVLNAIEPEIDKIKARLVQIMLETCVSTASVEGVSRFEKDYAIKENLELNLDDRKKQILSKMISKKLLTKDELSNFIKMLIDGSQFYITNLSEEYKFIVSIMDSELEDKLYKALYEARPAHLVFEVKLVSYERRCGTFRCNEKVV